MKVAVIGAGNFGICLAQHLARGGYSVALWSFGAEEAIYINQQRRHPHYLKDIELDDNITAYHLFSEMSLQECSHVVLATPTQFMRATLEALASFVEGWSGVFVCANKGIECDTLAFPLDIGADVLGPGFKENAVILSGPSFAEEVAHQQPTGVSMASYNEANVHSAQTLFHSPFFRAYTHKDPVGLEVAGAFKNVIAIASGACQGLGFQMNSRATLVTRGLSEIMRIGAKLGANPLTFMGLGGVGDLFLTCSSEKSRNFTVGMRLGAGETLDSILDSIGSVAEGVATSKAAYLLVKKIGIDAPITTEVYKVLYEGKSVIEGVKSLLEREPKPEHD